MDLVLEAEGAALYQTPLCLQNALLQSSLWQKLGSSETAATHGILNNLGPNSQDVWSQLPEALDQLHHLWIFPTPSRFYFEIDSAPPDFLEHSPECFQVLAIRAVLQPAS